MRPIRLVACSLLCGMLVPLAAGCAPGLDLSQLLAGLTPPPADSATAARTSVPAPQDSPAATTPSESPEAGTGGGGTPPRLGGGGPGLSSAARVAAFGLTNVKGMAYNPGPTNYTKTAGGIYYDSDFQSDDFSPLWGPGPDGRGRDDLRRFKEKLGINFIHPYDWSAPPARTHTAYFKRLRDLNMGTAVPFSNFVMSLILGLERQDWYGNPSNQRNVIAKGIITRTLNEVYGSGSTPDGAVKMIKVFNEFDLNYQAQDNAGAVVVALEFVHQWETQRAIPDANKLPIMAPTSFGVFQGIEGGDIKRVYQKAKASTILPPNFWEERMVYATNPQNDGPSITDYLANRFPAWLTSNSMPTLPIIFTELGSSTDQSGGEQQQADRFIRQIDASTPGQNNMIGACIFLNERRPWETGPEANFGILKFGSDPGNDWVLPASNYTVTRDYVDPGNPANKLRGTFPVEQQIPTLSYTAIKGKWGS